MGEIKSAWEIAMEKVEELDEITPEELKKQKEKKYYQIGQALADKYLDGIDLWQLNVELDKYKAEDRELLSQLVISKLSSSIELGNTKKLSKILEGISHFKQVADINEIGDELKQLFQEYESIKQKERQKKGKSAGEILSQMGISGTAIGEVNTNIIVGRQLDLGKLAKPYKDRLEQLKQKIVARTTN